MYKLVVVESPAKAKTIEGYLGKDYRVVSSVGHIRDLAKTGPGGLGIDVENNFTPTYTYVTGKKKLVKEIYKLKLGADEVLIATDPDREGEAIGWHLMQELELDTDELNRVVFSEITKDGIESGIKNKRKLDLPLVESQETRRIIDRIMGFKLSKLLQKKIKVKSAGRVQSVALLMIVNREIEIRNFVPVEYFKIKAFIDGIDLDYIDNEKKIEKSIADKIYAELIDGKYKLKVDEIKSRNKKLKAKQVYITSTFQQDAINKLNFTSRRAMSTAQKLYEGVEINGTLTGLITYMRTDSTRVADSFKNATLGFIETEYGKDYVGNHKIIKLKKNQQDAHEGIRPTSITNTPKKMKPFLTKDQFSIYQLIYNRALASLMADCQTETKSYIFKADNDNKFKISNTVVKFDGFRRVYNVEIDDEKSNFDFKVGDVLAVDKYEKSQHFTQPKPRYTEARLIKELEENGVGRPSTYSSIVETLKQRNYVELLEKAFVPTKDGELVVERLKQYFSDIINVEYTSSLELSLDEIAIGNTNRNVILTKFYDEFIKKLDYATENMEEIEVVKTGNICPECGSELVMRKGRYGEFEACSNFPKCKYITQNEREKIADCPECSGKIIEKRARKTGKVFYGCENFPKCKFAVWNLEELKGKKNEENNNDE